MIQITKSQCPRELTKYSNQRGASYKELPSEVKDLLRSSLLREQGFLCAYCMDKISPSESKIEHFHCQDKFPKEGLTYDNLLICCTGGGKKGKEVHCDSAKGNEVITCSPLDPACIESLSYDLYDGTIHSSNAEWDKELNDVLKLNIAKLKRKRKAALDGFLCALKCEAEPCAFLAKTMNRDQDGRLLPFYGIIRYCLEQKQASRDSF